MSLQSDNEELFWEHYNKRYIKKELPSFIKHELNEKSPYRISNYDLKFGDFCLYQTSDGEVMSYPEFAMFSSFGMADMALEYQFVMPIRTWDIKLIKKNRSYQAQTRINYEHDWDSYVYIFKVWKSVPNWKEMKKAYYDTFYYRLDRKSKISRLLNQ